MTDTITPEQIRAAGGIIHRDGNIFFTNIEQLRAALAQQAPQVAQQAAQVPPMDKELFNIYCDDVNADDLYSHSSNYYAGFRMGWKMAEPKGVVE